MKLKFVPFCSSCDALSDGILFCRSQIFHFLAKNHGLYIVHGLILRVRKNVVRKVCRSKGHEKRSLTAFVSVSQHLQQGNYERLKFFICCTFKWGILATKTFSIPKLKELQCHKLRHKLPLLAVLCT